MLKFFRLIRKQLLLENNTSRYLAYALGEILLVVLGILIALQINNWNEARKAKQQEQQLFSKLLSDLQSDSIMISSALTGFKSHQDLHYHLYDEMKGKASYDSTLEYGLLRWIQPFNLIVKENYQPIVDQIINETVRDSLNAYFRREEFAQTGWNEFTSQKINFVRPYLTSNNISDVDAVFSIARYEGNDVNKMLNYESMEAQFNTYEFGQVLYELRVKTAASIQTISFLKEANSQLLKTIQQALRK